MKKLQFLLIEHIFIFILCGAIYILIELLFRQRSDHTMFFLAGFCGSVFLSGLNSVLCKRLDFSLQVLLNGFCCTMAEWICGRICNSDYHIWDYRQLPLSSCDGQINLFFSLAWCVLCAAAIPFLDYLKWRLFSYRQSAPPSYKLFGRIRFDLGSSVQNRRL